MLEWAADTGILFPVEGFKMPLAAAKLGSENFARKGEGVIYCRNRCEKPGDNCQNM